MSFTNFLAKHVLQSLFGRTSTLGAFANAATQLDLHLGASTTTPNEAGGNFTEPGAGVSYARLDISASDFLDATEADPSLIENSAALTFPAASGAGWGTITHIGVFSSDVGGTNNLLMVLALDTPRTINAGETLSFSAGELEFTLD